MAEMFTSLPDDLRPTTKDLAPDGLEAVMDRLGFELVTDNPERKIPLSEFQRLLGNGPLAPMLWPEGAYKPEERIQFCDARGIGLQFVNPTFMVTSLRRVRDRHAELVVPFVEAYNDWAADVYRRHLDRFIPVTYLLLDDVGWACAELRRMREKGSRAFVFSFVPIRGRSLADPSLDPLWSTAVELAMIPFLHVGVARSKIDPAWAMVNGKVDPALALRLIFNENHIHPQTVLSALILGGVFDRHPQLTVVCQEFGISWIHSWMEASGFHRFTDVFEVLFGEWPCRRNARDYLGRNIRLCPLPRHRPDTIIRDFGEDITVFATDYPHPEGAESAKADFDALFERENVAPTARARFFGGNIEELLAR
jgi:predicted TIM-barrel fold metal-dependent hydrolase